MRRGKLSAIGKPVRALRNDGKVVQVQATFCGINLPPVPAPARQAPQIRPVVSRGLAAGHDPRFQCAPGERPHGAGFVAAGIGRDVTTGKPWEPR